MYLTLVDYTLKTSCPHRHRSVAQMMRCVRNYQNHHPKSKLGLISRDEEGREFLANTSRIAERERRNLFEVAQDLAERLKS